MSSPIPIPRTPAQWTPDERADTCHGCGSAFSMLRRRHHCRGCGRIFCHACTDQTIVIPSFVRHFMASTPTRAEDLGAEKRVCAPCHGQLHGARRSRTLVTVFASLPLPWRQVCALAAVSSLWKDAVRTIQLLWRSLPHRLAGTPHTRLEYELLRTHRRAVAGHARWMIQCYAAGLGCAGDRSAPCGALGCDASCHVHLTAADMLEIFNALPPSLLFDVRLAPAWHDLDPEEFLSLVPWYARLALERPQLARAVLVRLLQCDRALYRFLFELRIYWPTSRLAKQLFDDTLEAAPEELRADWLASYAFVEAVEQILDTRDSEQRAAIVRGVFGVAGARRVRAPWDPRVVITDVLVEGIVVLGSASRPTIVPLRTTTGARRILYKREDVRRDQVAMATAFWINRLTELEIPTYDVFPLTEAHGWVIMLEGTTTLYDIRRVHNTTLQNFLLDRSAGMTVRAFRAAFARSCASACVLSYVVGVGDRHLSNMLVTEDGRVVHIDFGYILGDDPKHVRTEMRVTADMVDTLGGKHSTTFELFRRTCIDAYRALRNRAPFWHVLLSHVAEQDRVRAHVLARLVPGHMQTEADDLLVEVVTRSSSSSWGQTITDTSHAWSTWARNLLPAASVFHMEL